MVFGGASRSNDHSKTANRPISSVCATANAFPFCFGFGEAPIHSEEKTFRATRNSSRTSHPIIVARCTQPSLSL